VYRKIGTRYIQGKAHNQVLNRSNLDIPSTASRHHLLITSCQFPGKLSFHSVSRSRQSPCQIFINLTQADLNLVIGLLTAMFGVTGTAFSIAKRATNDGKVRWISGFGG
jgi:hypothetical protein